MDDQQAMATGPAPSSVVKQLEGLKPRIAADRRQEYDELIEGLRQPEYGASYQWAHIDLISAFNPDTTIPEGMNVFRAVAGYLMFVPLVVTWLGLHAAIAAYVAMDEATRGGFFEEWLLGFSESGSGLFGYAPSLGDLALVTAFVFVAIILAGLVTDYHYTKTEKRRSQLRRALTEAIRVFDVRFPESTSSAVGAVRDLSRDLTDLTAQIRGVHEDLLDTQTAILDSSRESMSQLAAGFEEQQEQTFARLGVMIDQSTTTMLRVGDLMTQFADSAQGEGERRIAYERMLTHIADSAADLKDAAARLEDAAGK